MTNQSQKKNESSAEIPIEDAKLLIKESPYQFLPSLGHIFGDSEALILQQLHYVLHENPYFAGEPLRRRRWQGRLWVRIEMWMWWDDLEGLCRHLPERTFARKKARLEQFGVMLTTTELNRDRDDQTRWFTIDYDELKTREDIYLTELNRRRDERRMHRELLRRDDPDAHWRPNIRIPTPDESLARASCQNGRTVSPIIPKAKKPSTKSGVGCLPKWQDGECQNGRMKNAKMALSSSSNKKNSLESTEDHQQHAPTSGTDDVDDVVNSTPKPAPVLTLPGADNPALARDNEQSIQLEDEANAKHPKIPGAGIMPVSSVSASGEIAKIVAALMKLGTGATAKSIAPHVAADPENARKMLEWWPHLDHAAMKSPIAVFINALKNPGACNEPPILKETREAKERQARELAALALGEEANAEEMRKHEEKSREQARAAAKAREDLLKVSAERFNSLEPNVIELLLVKMAQTNRTGQALAKRFLRLNTEKISNPNAPAYSDFLEFIMEFDLFFGLVPEPAQSEDVAEELSAEASDELSPRYGRTVAMLVNLIEFKTIGFEGLDEYRAEKDFDFDNDEWEMMKEEVLARLKKAA